MEKKKRFSILKFVLIVICILLIVVSIFVNVAFSGGKTPKLLGKYIYVVSESDNMGGNVTVGAALIAPDAKDLALTKGDIVLCYPADDPNTLKVLSIYDIVTSEDGTERYVTADATNIGSAESITKDSVAALCTGYMESLELGSFITFASGIKGIVALLVLPCVLLMIFLIAKIASSKGDDEDEDFGFYEYDEEEKKKDKSESKKKSHEKTAAPLFEPSQEIQPSGELERKKMSIAENFSQKKVNPDSPYQKEKERTMQFKTQQRSAESSFAARNVGGLSSTAPTADALREEMLRKNSEAERTGTFNIKGTGASQEPITDNTGVFSKSQLAEISNAPKTAPLKSVNASPAAKPKKSSTPDISDIIDKSERNARKKSPADMSVDDLLKLIEDEKKKL